MLQSSRETPSKRGFEVLLLMLLFRPSNNCLRKIAAILRTRECSSFAALTSNSQQKVLIFIKGRTWLRCCIPKSPHWGLRSRKMLPPVTWCRFLELIIARSKRCLTVSSRGSRKTQKYFLNRSFGLACIKILVNAH